MLKYHSLDFFNIYLSIDILIIPKIQEIIKPRAKSPLITIAFSKFFIKDKTFAPKIAGIANKKENFKASSNFNPLFMLANKVDPDLDIPGNTAIPCTVPIIKASFIFKSFISLPIFFSFCIVWLIFTNTIAVIRKPTPTNLKSNLSIIVSNPKPIIAVGIQAISKIQISFQFLSLMIPITSFQKAITIAINVPKCKKASTNKTFSLKLIICLHNMNAQRT